jgi:hypothetical protein
MADGGKPTESQRMPTSQTLEHAVKLSIVEDKPVMLDYWVPSLTGKALIGVRGNADKLLVKSEEEYTSPIQKLYKSGQEYIIMTENSIYLVCNEIKSRKIS